AAHAARARLERLHPAALLAPQAQRHAAAAELAVRGIEIEGRERPALGPGAREGRRGGEALPGGAIHRELELDLAHGCRRNTGGAGVLSGWSPRADSSRHRPREGPSLAPFGKIDP